MRLGLMNIKKLSNNTVIENNSFFKRSSYLGKILKFCVNHKTLIAVLLTIIIIFSFSLIYVDTNKTLIVSRQLLNTVGTGTLGLIGFLVTGVAIFANKKDLDSQEVWKIYKSFRNATTLMIFNVIVIINLYIVTYIPLHMNRIIFNISLGLVSFLFFYSLLEITKLITTFYEIAMDIHKLINMEFKQLQEEYYYHTEEGNKAINELAEIAKKIKEQTDKNNKEIIEDLNHWKVALEQAKKDIKESS